MEHHDDQSTGSEPQRADQAAAEPVTGDPRVTHVGKAAADLTPAERRARCELARRVSARQPMITSTSLRRAAWFVR